MTCMKHIVHLWSALAIVALVASATSAQAQPQADANAAAPPRSAKLDLTAKTFAQLHALVRPQDHEWRHLKVNWMTDVIPARKKAAAENKPIVVLYTGGAGYNEPLGVC